MLPKIVHCNWKHRWGRITVVVSHKGAVGLMQIMPATAQYLAKKSKIKYKRRRDLKNPFINIRLGVFYLARLRDYYDGNEVRFLSAYNAGPGKVDRIIKRTGNYKPNATKDYIQKVKARTKRFRILLRNRPQRV